MEGSMNDDFQNCSRCKKTKCFNDFGLKKNGKYYQQCIDCRDKKNNNQRDKISNDIDNTIDYYVIEEKKKDKKRENRPTISTQKQQLILKEQDYMCRGPGPNDNKEYECDMKKNGKRFSDKKSSEPQYDHIIRWKDGGNGIGNIQALCANCHLMKTSMENLINEDEKALECPRIKTIYESLTKPKYQEIESSVDSSSSDEDNDFTSRKSFRIINASYKSKTGIY